jgi:hypothetical protein
MRGCLRLLVLLCASFMLSGCLAPKMYLDPTLPKVAKSDLATATAPQPIQVLYEFQTKGSANARATNITRDKVMATAGESGLFTTISADPQDNQRRLTIVINNVPITQDGASKGFGVGLTLGLVGTMVTDGYECTAVLSVPGAEAVKFQYTHAIHSTIGNASGPPGLTAEPTPRDAVNKLVEQITWSILRDVSRSGRL